MIHVLYIKYNDKLNHILFNNNKLDTKINVSIKYIIVNQ